jgi:hypothetical protein
MKGRRRELMPPLMPEKEIWSKQKVIALITGCWGDDRVC